MLNYTSSGTAYRVTSFLIYGPADDPDPLLLYRLYRNGDP